MGGKWLVGAKLLGDGPETPLATLLDVAALLERVQHGRDGALGLLDASYDYQHSEIKRELVHRNLEFRHFFK